jgi:hypothetical protein
MPRQNRALSYIAVMMSKTTVLRFRCAPEEREAFETAATLTGVTDNGAGVRLTKRAGAYCIRHDGAGEAG